MQNRGCPILHFAFCIPIVSDLQFVELLRKSPQFSKLARFSYILNKINPYEYENIHCYFILL